MTMNVDPDPLEIDSLDPDFDHVPEELRRLNGRPVRLVDGETGEPLAGDCNVLAVAPGLFGASARLEED